MPPGFCSLVGEVILGFAHIGHMIQRIKIVVNFNIIQ